MPFESTLFTHHEYIRLGKNKNASPATISTAGNFWQTSIRGCNSLRDWSLISGRGGGAKKREGGHVKLYPYERGGGGGQGFNHAEGGYTKFWGIFFPQKLEVLAILKGGGNVSTRLKAGRKRFYPVLTGGGGGVQKVSNRQFSHFVAPSPSSW